MPDLATTKSSYEIAQAQDEVPIESWCLLGCLKKYPKRYSLVEPNSVSFGVYAASWRGKEAPRGDIQTEAQRKRCRHTSGISPLESQVPSHWFVWSRYSYPLDIWLHTKTTSKSFADAQKVCLTLCFEVFLGFGEKALHKIVETVNQALNCARSWDTLSSPMQRCFRRFGDLLRHKDECSPHELSLHHKSDIDPWSDSSWQMTAAESLPQAKDGDCYMLRYAMIGCAIDDFQYASS